MMKSLTVEDVMSIQTCFSHSREKIESLWAGKESLSLLEILDLDISIYDRFGLILRPMVIGERLCYLLNIDFAEHVLHYYESAYPKDNGTLRKCVEIARKFVNGDANRGGLFAAAHAVGDARADAREEWLVTLETRGDNAAVHIGRAALSAETVEQAALVIVQSAWSAARIARGVVAKWTTLGSENQWQLEHVKDVLKKEFGNL